LLTYFPRIFRLPFSPDHLRIIRYLEQVILDGGLRAIAAPRATGKTSMLRCACLWALSRGSRRYLLFLGGDEKKAAKNLAAIKRELETNDLLAADFPEVCWPIRALEGVSQRAHAQTLDGRPTHLGWSQTQVILPSVPGSTCSGAILEIDGLLGAVRGPNHTTPDGEVIRPDLVIGDDIQTDDSARSPLQCKTRLDIVRGALLGLAGPGVEISAVILGTVICPGDAMDQLLDRNASPAWRGVRYQLVYKWPDNSELWDQYGERLRQELGDGGDGSKTTEFYRRNRQAMDAGAEVAWPERYTKKEFSAIQHAYNLLITRGRYAFTCEYQNAPEEEDAVDELTAQEIRQRLNGFPRAEVPTAADYLVAHVDVHDALLWWTVAAVRADLTAWVIDYGTWPGQRRAYFTMRQAKVTLQTEYRAKTKEGAILAGLLALWEWLLEQQCSTSDGTETRKIDLVGVDIGYLPDTVESAITRDGRSQIIRPTRGVPIGPANRPISEWNYKPGDRRGHNWGLFRRKGRRYRWLEFDANAWKTFKLRRFQQLPGEPGSLTLWGADPDQHTLFSDHQASEKPHEVEGGGRRMHQWLLRPNVENHWHDNLVGCLVGASYLGAALSDAAPPRRRRRRKIRVKRS